MKKKYIQLLIALIVLVFCICIFYNRIIMAKQKVVLQFDNKTVQLTNIGVLKSNTDGLIIIDPPKFSRDYRYISVIGIIDNDYKQFIFDTKDERLLNYEDSFFADEIDTKNDANYYENSVKWISDNQFIAVKRDNVGLIGFLTRHNIYISRAVKVNTVTKGVISKELDQDAGTQFLWSYDNNYIYFISVNKSKGNGFYKVKVNYGRK